MSRFVFGQIAENFLEVVASNAATHACNNLKDKPQKTSGLERHWTQQERRQMRVIRFL